MCLFHKYVGVEEVEHSACGLCFRAREDVPDTLKARYPRGYCPHSIVVCLKCKKARGYGSHGALSIIPDGCKDQVRNMGGLVE